jgi:hypothetical protein
MNPATETAGFAAPKNTTQITIVDNAEGDDQPGTYLTAYTVQHDGFLLTVDYFAGYANWSVYVTMTTDEPTTTATMSDLLAAHENGQGIADYLNANELTTKLNERHERRHEFDGLVLTV